MAFGAFAAFFDRGRGSAGENPQIDQLVEDFRPYAESITLHTTDRYMAVPGYEDLGPVEKVLFISDQTAIKRIGSRTADFAGVGRTLAVLGFAAHSTGRISAGREMANVVENTRWTEFDEYLITSSPTLAVKTKSMLHVESSAQFPKDFATEREGTLREPVAMNLMFKFGEKILNISVGATFREMAMHVRTRVMDLRNQRAPINSAMAARALEGMTTRWAIIDKNQIKVVVKNIDSSREIPFELREAQRLLAPMMRKGMSPTVDPNTGRIEFNTVAGRFHVEAVSEIDMTVFAARKDAVTKQRVQAVERSPGLSQALPF